MTTRTNSHVLSSRLRVAITLCGAVVVLLADSRSIAGILGDAAEQAHSDGDDDSSDDDRDDGDDDDSGIGSLLWSIATSGSKSSRGHCNTYSGSGSVEVDVDSTPPVMFAPFPYSQDATGILVPPNQAHINAYSYSGRFAFEYGNDFDVLDRFAGSALFEWNSGLGFDASGHIYREDLGDGEHDELSVGDVNVFLRLFDTERIQWRLGVGVNWLADSIDAEAGINGTLRADFFPAKPFIFSGEIDYGQVGETHTFHGRASAGFNVQQTEFFIGYDYRSIGDVDLEGPMLGVQFWY